MDGSAGASVVAGATLHRRVADCTVLFADITGSTRLYRQLGDHAARAVIAGCLERASNVLAEYRGRTVKSIGDELMCVFPDPDRAVQAACAMQRQLTSSTVAGQAVAMHAGMQAGSVLLERGDVFGDTVNTANYLCALATTGQILTSESTAARLSHVVRASTRPLFYAHLKGSPVQHRIHEVLWQADSQARTDLNVLQHLLLPPDLGSVVVSAGDIELRLDPRHPEAVFGRSADCDLVIADPYASRRHCCLRLRRTQFFLTDLSVNGTFIRRPDGETAHLLRAEMLIDGEGEISLGRAFDQPQVRPIRFRRDRRSLFRP